MSVITSSTVTVRSLFEGSKRVPEYQRDYSWQKSTEIKALFDDLTEHFGIEDGRFGTGREDDYLLGPIVVTSEETPAIIDGQQRILTLHILLAAIRYRLLELRPEGGNDVAALGQQLMTFGDDDRPRSRMMHHDALANDLLTELAGLTAADDIPRGTNDSLSHRRLAHGFKFLVQRLRELMPAEYDLIADFARFLKNYVKLIEIRTENVGQALIVFERANYRGRPLDPSDLLKNYIFQFADSESFADLAGDWSRLQVTLEEINNVRIIDFLRWYHLGVPGGVYTTKNNFFTKVQEYAADLGVKNSRTYLSDLNVKASALNSMATQFKHPRSGAQVPGLAGIDALGGGRQKQHWPLLLATWDWSKSAFEDVVRGLERVLFYSAVTDYRSQALERDIRALTETARELADDEVGVRRLSRELDAVAAKIRAENLYDERFVRLSYDDSKYATRFALTKVHDGLYRLFNNMDLRGASAASTDFAKSEVEHIWPQSDGEALALEDDDGVVHRIGNLALASKALNASAGKRSAAEKLSGIYKDEDSKFIILRNLNSRQVPGGQGNTAQTRAVNMAPTGFETWGHESIDRLAIHYRSMLDEIMPALIATEEADTSA